MPFRTAAWFGTLAIAALGLFLGYLWSPGQQVRRHSDRLLAAIEHHHWEKFSGFIATDYRDQWSEDRNLVLERTREIFAYAGAVHLRYAPAKVRTGDGRGWWRARIM